MVQLRLRYGIIWNKNAYFFFNNDYDMVLLAYTRVLPFTLSIKLSDNSNTTHRFFFYPKRGYLTDMYKLLSLIIHFISSIIYQWCSFFVFLRKALLNLYDDSQVTKTSLAVCKPFRWSVINLLDITPSIAKLFEYEDSSQKLFDWESIHRTSAMTFQQQHSIPR